MLISRVRGSAPASDIDRFPPGRLYRSREQEVGSRWSRAGSQCRKHATGWDTLVPGRTGPRSRPATSNVRLRTGALLMLGAIAGDIIGSVYEHPSRNVRRMDFPLF